MSQWDCVRLELERWGQDMSPARLWLRDDDAIDTTGQLERLVALTDKFSIPATLAVIPNLATDALASRLENCLQISVALHGISHLNRAPASEKKCELGLHRGQHIVVEELASGRLKLEQMFGQQFINMLVPPWNKIAAQLVPELSKTGLSTLSAYGWDRFPATANLVQFNTHVDIIDWRGTRGGRPASELASELANALRIARDKGGEPVGILSHHLVHDDAAWEFLQQLFTFSKARNDIHWCQAALLSGTSIG